MERKFLTRKEVQAIYGLGYTALRRLVFERKLKRVKVGKAWRYPVADLEKIFSPRKAVFAQ